MTENFSNSDNEATAETSAKKEILSNFEGISKNQRRIALIFYVSIVIAGLITIGGTVYTIADLIMATGKMELFLDLSLGFQIAIIGGLLAGLFFLVILFYGLYKKGVKSILHILFREREIAEKYQNKLLVKIIAGALMISVFMIIVGFIYSIFQYLLLGIIQSSEVTLATIFANFSQGQIVLLVGGIVFLIIGLFFLFNYLWYNGYYFIINLIYSLEPEE
ncbi:MAG: hypothetical protein ACOC4M_00640 [Promethearchaeia archaeon]